MGHTFYVANVTGVAFAHVCCCCVLHLNCVTAFVVCCCCWALIARWERGVVVDYALLQLLRLVGLFVDCCLIAPVDLRLRLPALLRARYAPVTFTRWLILVTLRYVLYTLVYVGYGVCLLRDFTFTLFVCCCVV